MNDRPGSGYGPLKWQTRAMNHAVELLRGVQRNYVTLEPDKDLNEEVEWNDKLEGLIERFTPRIRLVGWGLWSKRFGLWDSMSG